MMPTEALGPRGDRPTDRDDRPARSLGQLSAAAALLEALAGDPSPDPAGRDASGPAETLPPAGWEGQGVWMPRRRPTRPTVPAPPTETRNAPAHRPPANVSVPQEDRRAPAAPPSAAQRAASPTPQADGPITSAYEPAARSASRAEPAPPTSLEPRPISPPAAPANAASASRAVTLHVNQLYVQSPAELAELAADARHRAGIDL